MSDLSNPFCTPAPPHWGVPYVEYTGVEDRLRRIKEMNVDDLERVIAKGWMYQTTVVKAAGSRLRKLRRMKGSQ